ncbi:MAG: gp58-like family protein [Tannerella sp.]|jgi:hypothetical protein|nr:gp58-like family protein [Tannerella sp.]
MKLYLYSRENVLKATVSPDDSSVNTKGVMDDNVLSLSFVDYAHFNIDVNDYADFNGERFYALEKYAPEQKSTVEWSYSFQLYGIESLIKRVLVLKMVDTEMNPVFSLTAPAYEHVKLFVDNMNRVLGGTNWKVGEVIPTANIVADYNGTYISDGLNQLAELAGTEWWVEGSTVNLSRCEHGESLDLAYHNGLLSLSRDTNENAKFFTRLYPIGSSRNIDRTDYNYSRLQLPDRSPYREQNLEYGIIEHFEEEAFSHIYPRRFGTVGTVRTEQRTGDDGNPFTIYYFTDPSLTFDPNSYMMPGLVLNIVWQGEIDGEGGELEGRDFEVNFDSNTQEFEIITQFPYDDETQLPGGTLIPKPGDKYILYNLKMPTEYITAAELEFEQAVADYMQRSAMDKSVYKAPTDYLNLISRGIDLILGQRVKLESAQYFPGAGFRNSRVTRISRKVNNPLQMDIEISDTVDRGKMAALEGSITEIDRYVRQTFGGMPGIIKTGDTTLPTDTNLFSARRSLREFLSKRNDDTAQGLITFLKGIALGKYVQGQSGATIDAQGNAEFLSVVIRNILRSADFVDGFTGEGWGIGIDPVTGLSSMTVDKLTVRQTLAVFELLIEKIRSVGGQIIVSAANGTVKSIDNGQLTIDNELTDCYILTFEEENEFAVGDLVRCQVFTGSKMKSYWVEVAGTGATSITVPISEFGGATPAAGDELVLMGNTENPLRQNLISISATEDGQPRIDVLNGVKEKNFNGALRARLGNLDGIFDSWFPLDKQPQGDGIYADNAYLRGNFVLVNGKDVKTEFEVMDGKFNSVISSVLDDMSGAEGNVLRNSSFYRNLWYWTSENLVSLINVSGPYLHVGGAFYTEKQHVADIVFDGSRNVLRIKTTSLKQINADLAPPNPPEGGALPGTYNISFFYRALSEGTLTVGFEGKELFHTETLSSMAAYQKMTVSAKWDGTGDFEIGFTGEILIYGLILSSDAYADAIVQLETRITQTESQILLMATETYVDSATNQIYQQLTSELSITAGAISAVSSRVSALEQASAGWITTADGNQLWASLQSYNTLTNTLTQQQSSITQLAGSITSAVQSITTIDGLVSTHSSLIQQLSNSISTVVQEVDAITGAEIVSRINQTASTITIDASKINLVGDITANGNVHINTDGTIVAKGGRFDGYLSFPFREVEDSDATEVSYNAQYVQYKVNQHTNLICTYETRDIPNLGLVIVRQRIILPQSSAFNGVIVNLFNPFDSAGSLGSMSRTQVVTENGLNIFDNTLTSDDKTLTNTVDFHGAMLQFLCVVSNSQTRWIMLNGQT